MSAKPDTNYYSAHLILLFIFFNVIPQHLFRNYFFSLYSCNIKNCVLDHNCKRESCDYPAGKSETLSNFEEHVALLLGSFLCDGPDSVEVDKVYSTDAGNISLSD